MSSSSKTKSTSALSTKTKKNVAKSTSTKTKKTVTKKKTATTNVKTGKTKAITKNVKEKTVKAPLQEDNAIVEKILDSIKRLGDQIFALSPFNQYYDDWIVNLRRIVSEFGTDSNVKVDQTFTEKCEQIFEDVQVTLVNLRAQEVALAVDENILLKVNQELKEVDVDYAKRKHELSNKSNADTERLTTQIKTFEEDIENQRQVKFSFFQFSGKENAAKKLEQTKRILKETQNQLEVALQDFTVEQNRLQDEYTAKKQELTVKADTHRKAIEQVEVDASRDARKEACTRLNDIIGEQIKQQSVNSSN